MHLAPFAMSDITPEIGPRRPGPRVGLGRGPVHGHRGNTCPAPAPPISCMSMCTHSPCAHRRLVEKVVPLVVQVQKSAFHICFKEIL